MFRNATMLEAFERAAEPADWSEFCSLAPVDDGDHFVVSLIAPSGPPTPYVRNVMRYRELWIMFAEAVRSKLIAGDWVADGFNPQLGARPVQIDSRLWRVLEFALGHDRAEGGGYSFINMSFSELVEDNSFASQRDLATLRTELVRWIEAQAQASPGPMTIEQVLDAARRAFHGTKITNNLFSEAWRAANKPEHFRQRGRPKAKG